MAERICSVEDCENPAVARGICNRHYLRARKAGTLPATTWLHRLSNIDLANRTADCGVCGPSVRIHLRSSGRTECLIARRSTKYKYNPATERKRRLRVKYGITEDDYQRLFDEQRGLCAVCEQPSHGRLCVDHCHETGRVRGLLCRPCNLSLGYLRDDSYNAVSAAKYLMKIARPRPA